MIAQWPKPETFYLGVALAIATEAHAGQKYGTQDYIEHPKRLAAKFNSAALKIIALLHDTVEDGKITVNDIAIAFDWATAEVVDILTRKPGQLYMEDYIPKIAENEAARQVKIEDLKDHITHMEAFPENKKKLPRYYTALAILESYKNES